MELTPGKSSFMSNVRSNLGEGSLSVWGGMSYLQQDNSSSQFSFVEARSEAGGVVVDAEMSLELSSIIWRSSIMIPPIFPNPRQILPSLEISLSYLNSQECIKKILIFILDYLKQKNKYWLDFPYGGDNHLFFS